MNDELSKEYLVIDAAGLNVTPKQARAVLAAFGEWQESRVAIFTNDCADGQGPARFARLANAEHNLMSAGGTGP